MLSLGNVRDDVSKFDEVWVIVRSPGSIRFTGNKKHIPLLSPNKNLFYEYKRLKDRKMWNSATFTSRYVPAFLEQMKGAEEQALLKELVTLSRSKNIMLCCFCADEAMCHRSIVAGILQNMGAIFTPETPDYRKYKIN